MAESIEANLQELRAEYDRRSGTYKSLEEEALFVMAEQLSARGIKYHALVSRVKSPDSFLDKAQRKTLQNPFAEVTDLVGLRVVCLFLSDVPLVGAAIRDCFDVLSEDNKIEDQEMSSFGYMSVHFIAKMKKTYQGPRYDRIAGVPLEIQVRTIAMDAWANVSHYLAYKTTEDIPKNLKRDFFALSGLFYVADTHFEMFFKSREQSRGQIAAEVSSKTADLSQRLDLDNLTAYLSARLPDREHSSGKTFADFLQELSASGYDTLDKLDRAMERGWAAFEEYEKVNPPGSRTGPRKKGGRFADVGVVRILLDIVDPNHAKIRGVDSKPYKDFRKLVKATDSAEPT